MANTYKLNLYTIHYKNYFNRHTMYETSGSNYLVDTYFTEGHQTTYVSFNPNDGVETNQIVNYDATGDDYAVLMKVEYDEDEEIVGYEIKSRWFIMECKRERTGQYNLTLRRDVIVDNIDNLIDAPIFVQRGHLNKNDHMICNNEGFIFNQIKKGETLLKDGTGCPWIIAYVNPTMTSKTISFATTTPSHYVTSSDIEIATGIDASDIEDLVLGISPLKFSNGTTNVNFAMANFGAITKTLYKEIVNSSFSSSTHRESTEFGYNNDYLYYLNNPSTSDYTNVGNAFHTTINTNPKVILNCLKAKTTPIEIFDSETYQKLIAFNGQTILISGNYYTINIGVQSSSSANYELLYNETTTTTSLFTTLWNNIDATTRAKLTINSSNGKIFINMDAVNEVVGVQTEVTGITGSLTIPSTMNKCSGMPCKMIAIPYGKANWCNGTGQTQGTATTSNTDLILGIVQEMITQLGSDLYDVQLLPYFPWQSLLTYDVDQAIDEYAHINIDGLADQYDYSPIKDGNNNVISYAFFPKTNSFTIPILGLVNTELGVETEPNDWVQLATNESLKVASNCEMYRICSPNYQGMFEFNLGMNGGSVGWFKADCTYKPFVPYIRVCPEFSFLYGENYGDNRGLICGGDFSMTQTKDAWIQYQLQNKNYINMFDREMQTLNLGQRQQEFQEPFKFGAGVVGGGVGGALVGGKAGGVYGAVAGAVAGVGAGIVGGVLDMQMSAEMRANTKDYAIDRFNYQLGNIKALPNSLTKISTFTINNKLFPFIEYYSCSDEEKEAFKDKIDWNSMNVGRIGTMREFIREDDEHWFQGQLIYNDYLKMDAHEVNAIYDELLKGVYW